MHRTCARRSFQYLNTRNLTRVNITYDPEIMALDRFNPGTMPGYQALFVIDPALRQNNSKNSRGLPPANSSGNSNCGLNSRHGSGSRLDIIH
jgi:hypothetical protein